MSADRPNEWGNKKFSRRDFVLFSCRGLGVGAYVLSGLPEIIDGFSLTFPSKDRKELESFAKISTRFCSSHPALGEPQVMAETGEFHGLTVELQDQQDGGESQQKLEEYFKSLKQYGNQIINEVDGSGFLNSFLMDGLFDSDHCKNPDNIKSLARVIDSKVLQLNSPENWRKIHDCLMAPGHNGKRYFLMFYNKDGISLEEMEKPTPEDAHSLDVFEITDYKPYKFAVVDPNSVITLSETVVNSYLSWPLLKTTTFSGFNKPGYNVEFSDQPLDKETAIHEGMHTLLRETFGIPPVRDLKSKVRLAIDKQEVFGQEINAEDLNELMAFTARFVLPDDVRFFTPTMDYFQFLTSVGEASTAYTMVSQVYCAVWDKIIFQKYGLPRTTDPNFSRLSLPPEKKKELELDLKKAGRAIFDQLYAVIPYFQQNKGPNA